MTHATTSAHLSPACHASISGVILAGGRGQRMHGADKGLLEWRGRPLIEHALERLRPQVACLCLSVNRNLEHYARWPHPLLRDHLPHHAGPLAGIHAALLATRTPWLVTVPCDAPCFPPDLVARLHAHAATSGALAVSLHTDDGAQPVFALYHRSLAPALSDFLARGERKLQGWQHTLGAASLYFADSAAFLNLNTPQCLTHPLSNHTPRKETP